MARIERPTEDTLILHLSESHSLELERIQDAKRYRIVFAERTGVHRHDFVEIDYDMANTLSRFLASVYNPGQQLDSNEGPDLPTIEPSVPRTKSRI